MTINDLIKLAIKKLKNSPSPALDGEVLLSFVLKKPKEFLFTNPNLPIQKKYMQKYIHFLNLRSRGWPVAYLVNEKDFFGLKFYVDKNVLIPRPETEGLVELALERISAKAGTTSGEKHKNKLKILDIGTGSGNIIISLAKTLSANSHELDHSYFASDISAKALDVAKKNARLAFGSPRRTKQHKVKVAFKQGSLLKPWKNQSFDIIVANLPYLDKESDASTKFEPKSALIATEKNLRLFAELFKQISTIYYLLSIILLEIGHDQSDAIKKLATKILPDYKIKIFKDLFGRPRYAALTLVRKSS